MDHTQDANAVCLNAIHEAVFVNERLAPVLILEFGDHSVRVRQNDEQVSSLPDSGYDFLGLGWGVER